MNEEEIKKMKEENETLKKKVETLEESNTALKEENEEYKATNTQLDEESKEKDKSISDLKVKLQEQGLNFKKLRDMTKEEKELLTEKELELLKRTEEIEDANKKNKAEMDQFRKEQKDALIDKIARAKAGGNEELFEKIKVNLSKLNPKLLEEANTEDKITPLIDTSFNMLGELAPKDTLRDAHNADGSSAPIDATKDYSNTEAGKEVAKVLNLNQAQPTEEKK